MRIFELTKGFPREETYSLTDQIRRSSRSACSNIAEAWRKCCYGAEKCGYGKPPLQMMPPTPRRGGSPYLPSAVVST
ncbi:MAG: four helix bundle protein [Chloroflexi bacterium]|nr:four helix bundle protein [Chloroflexota bacterium]